MATATVSYGAALPQAQTLYGPPRPDPEHHALKKAYLGLLPPQQIIEICLMFEAHVPLHVQASVWPIDLKAAIAAMHQKLLPPPPASNANVSREPTPSEKRHGDEPPPMASLRDTSQPVPPDKPPETTSAAPERKNATPGPSTNPIQTVSTTVPPNQPVSISQPAYPHQPYGVTQQATYPHAPYYTASGTSYSYPHTTSGYTPYSSNGSFSHTGPPPNPFPNTTPISHHGSEVSPADLPSYEEIIAEALAECADPEGSVPKNIFTWMSSRYPLQSNFRPSASQALQKAYKRGRFEKSNNGKYRLSPMWEGGSSTRRARRPQTEKQMPPPPDRPPKASPFTRAPLETKRTAPSQGPLSGNFPYTYPPPPQTHPEHPGGYASQQGAGNSSMQEDTSEGSDAWEAAQNILKAINFGSLIQMTQQDGKGAEEGGKGVLQTESAHPPPVIASARMDFASMGQPKTPTGSGNAGTTVSAVLSAEDRASLQAQLALLAAQMAALAEGSEDTFTQGLHAPTTGDTTITKDDVASDGDAEGYDEEDEDNDMEMVEVPTAPEMLHT